jgi:alpha-glucosidase
MIGTEGLIAYGRFDVNNQAVIIINHMEAARHITLPVWQLGVEDGKRAMARIMQTTDNYYNVGREKYDVEDGNVRVFVPAGSATILVAGKHGYRVG